MYNGNGDSAYHHQEQAQEEAQGHQPAAVDEYLKEYFQTHNIHRGGYGQPLPIQFKEINEGRNNRNSLVDTALHGGRWIDVMEEATSQRFKEAVGPIGPFVQGIG